MIPDVHEEYSRQQCRTPGHERVIRGLELRHERRLEIALFIDGTRRTALQIPESAGTLVAEAIRHAQRRPERFKVGEFEDGRMRIELWAGHHFGRPALYFQKFAADGAAGRPTTCFDRDLDAIERGLSWLMS